MKPQHQLASLSKTQNYMYSTMAPPTTPRRRYHDRQHSVTLKKSTLEAYNNPEINQFRTNVSQQYRKQLKTPNLPQIKKEKGFMLEQWINSALQNGMEGDYNSKQPLKTLKKYELDKASLRNFNLSFQAIQKLHKGLFIYTQGIKNSFNEMLSQAQTMPRDDNLLQKMYFTVFIKLIQNIIPIKTCFQLIDESQKKDILQLKKQKLSLLSKLQSERKLFHQSELKLLKQIQQQQNKMKANKIDYQIMESTMQMYERNFNEEVALRLKFQEKINITYTLYEELKMKYDMMKEDLSNKNKELRGNGEEYSSVKEQLHSQLVKNAQLIRQLEQLQEKIIALDKDLLIKHQQIADLTLTNRNEQQKKLTEENIIQNLLISVKNLKKHKEEQEVKITELQEINQKNLNTIDKLKNDLISAREKNDDIYIRFHQHTLKYIPLEQNNYQQQLKIQEITQENLLLNTKHNLSQESLVQHQKQLETLQNQLTLSTKTNTLYCEQLQKMKQTVSQLKQSKDRFQRINAKQTQELVTSRKQLQSKILELYQSKSKLVDLQFQLNETQKNLNNAQARSHKLQNDLKGKQTQAEQLKLKSKRQKRQIEQQINNKQSLLVTAKAIQDRLTQECNRKDNQKLKKIEQITFLNKNSTFLQKQLRESKNSNLELKEEIQKKNGQINRLNKQIVARDFILSKKKQENQGEIANLKLLVNKFKEKNDNKSQYTHPMIAQDLVTQVERLKNKIVSINQANAEMNRTYSQLQQELKGKNTTLTNKIEEIQILKNKSELQVKEIGQLKQELKSKEVKIKEQSSQTQSLNPAKQNQTVTLKSTIQKLQNQIKSLTVANQSFKQDIQKLQKALAETLIKPIVSNYQSQTDPVKNENTSFKKENHSTASQTDQGSANNHSNGRKLVVPDKPKIKEEEEAAQTGSIVHHNHPHSLETKKHEGIPIAEEKHQKQKDSASRQPDKKVEEREFKTALRLTYMRK